MTIGKKIRKLRRDRDWLQRDVAEKIMVSAGIVTCWEQDKNEPSIYNCILLADLFNVTLDELCCRYERGDNSGNS